MEKLSVSFFSLYKLFKANKIFTFNKDKKRRKTIVRYTVSNSLKKIIIFKKCGRCFHYVDYNNNLVAIKILTRGKGFLMMNQKRKKHFLNNKYSFQIKIGILCLGVPSGCSKTLLGASLIPQWEE